MREVTMEQWRAEGESLFGPDEMQWKFVCPICKHEQSAQDYKDAGAPESAVAFNCVGRYVDGSRSAFHGKVKGPGPCDYSGGGLFKVNPVHIEGRNSAVFEFAKKGEN